MLGWTFNQGLFCEVTIDNITWFHGGKQNPCFYDQHKIYQKFIQHFAKTSELTYFTCAILVDEESIYHSKQTAFRKFLAGHCIASSAIEGSIWQLTYHQNRQRPAIETSIHSPTLV
jgi:hypothetical protein